MNIVKIIASACRRKILKTLFGQRASLAIMELVRLTNSTYNEVNRNLRILEAEGIISQKYSGRRHIITLNKANKKTALLFNILKDLDSHTDNP